MEIDLGTLPDDIETLHHLIGDLVAARESERDEARAEIERLRQIVKLLQCNSFGRRSERLDDDQMLLGLEGVVTDIARAEAALPQTSAAKARTQKAPPGLPDHLERRDVHLDIDADACPDCRGAIHAIGETVSEMLDWVAARHPRPPPPLRLPGLRHDPSGPCTRTVDREGSGQPRATGVGAGQQILRSPAALPAVAKTFSTSPEEATSSWTLSEELDRRVLRKRDPRTAQVLLGVQTHRGQGS